jgi:hypothetical protein
VHAILATRRDVRLGLHQLRLAGQLAEIRAADLRFSGRETSELLDAAGIALSAAGAALLHQRTEGWAAGLRLAAISLTGHPDPEWFVAEFSGSDRTVAEYLLAEMLERQPPEVQDLLLRTSLLDRVNGELADLLTGRPGSERILLSLEDANAFVESLAPGGPGSATTTCSRISCGWSCAGLRRAGQAQAQRRHPVPAQLKQVVRASADEVDVRVVESGDHAMPERVDHARTRPDQNSNVALIAHGGDAASGHGERGGLRPGGIPGRDPAVAEDEIGRSRHARARRSCCGQAVLGTGEGTSVLIHAGVRSRAGLAAGGDVRRPTAG